MTNSDSDLRFMHMAFDLAIETRNLSDNDPIAAVIVREGKVIGRGGNLVKSRCDPTAHAEIVAIQAACKAIGEPELRGATLYSTLQPCGMCTMASIWTKISRIVYGAGRGDVHDMYFEDRHLDTDDFIADAYRDDLVMTGGVLRAHCAYLYTSPEADIPVEEQVNR